MAKINFGGVVQDARGSQNGLVYSRNKGGAYVRRKVTPVNPKSIRQQQVRASFGANAKAWSGTLTQAQRDAWTAFAASNPITDIFGLSITLTGLSTYQRLNQVLANIGGTPESDPPADLSVNDLGAVNSLAASSTLGTVSFATDDQTAPDDNAYYIFMTPPLAQGINPNQSLYRYVATVPGVHSGTDIDVTAEYTALFGALSPDKNIWAIVAGVNTSTGAVTPGLKFMASIA